MVVPRENAIIHFASYRKTTCARFLKHKIYNIKFKNFFKYYLSFFKIDFNNYKIFNNYLIIIILCIIYVLIILLYIIFIIFIILNKFNLDSLICFDFSEHNFPLAFAFAFRA